MALSSFFISSCVFHLKNQLSILNASTDLVSSPNSNNSTRTFPNTISNNFVLTESKEFILKESSEFFNNNNSNQATLNKNTSSTEYSFYETFCSMNEKLSTSIFKLFERSKTLKRADLADLMQIKKHHHHSYHNHHYPLIQQFILK